MDTNTKKIAAVFAEWNRRYKENPERFQTISFEPEDAALSAEYFEQLHNELFPTE